MWLSENSTLHSAKAQLGGCMENLCVLLYAQTQSPERMSGDFIFAL